MLEEAGAEIETLSRPDTALLLALKRGEVELVDAAGASAADAKTGRATLHEASDSSFGSCGRARERGEPGCPEGQAG